jgi:hypothetical protein
MTRILFGQMKTGNKVMTMRRESGFKKGGN